MNLSQIPFVDNHAHPLTRAQPRTSEELRRHFSEAHAASMARDHVGSSIPFRWALRQLGDFLRTSPTADAILAQRRESGYVAYTRRLIQAANIAYLLLDEGFPPPDLCYSPAELRELLRVPIGRILRLETLLQSLIPACADLSELLHRFDAALEHARQRGCVALKSIAAYRTGLVIEPVTESDAAAALRRLQLPTIESERFRLADKLLIDFFVYRALRWAAEHAMPLQFHTGYGDPDLDLRLANPLHLRGIFEDATLSAAPIVLLHGSYPYTSEAAFLAAVYPNAYLDISFSLPPLGGHVLHSVLRTALATAPAGKVLASSDGTCIPEHYWLGATRARSCLSRVLTELVEHDEIGTDDANEIGRLILHDTAMRLYRLGGHQAPGLSC